MESEWTEDQLERFWKANNHNKRAIQKILKEGEFDAWTDWNRTLWATVQAMKVVNTMTPPIPKARQADAINSTRAFILDQTDRDEMASSLADTCMEVMDRP